MALSLRVTLCSGGMWITFWFVGWKKMICLWKVLTGWEWDQLNCNLYRSVSDQVWFKCVIRSIHALGRWVKILAVSRLFHGDIMTEKQKPPNHWYIDQRFGNFTDMKLISKLFKKFKCTDTFKISEPSTIANSLQSEPIYQNLEISATFFNHQNWWLRIGV